MLHHDIHGQVARTRQGGTHLRKLICRPQGDGQNIDPYVTRYLRALDQIVRGALQYVGYADVRGSIGNADVSTQNRVIIDAEYSMLVSLQASEDSAHVAVRVDELGLSLRFPLGPDALSPEDVTELFGKLQSLRVSEYTPLQEKIIGQLDTLCSAHGFEQSVSVSPWRLRPGQVVALTLQLDNDKQRIGIFQENGNRLVFRLITEHTRVTMLEVDPTIGLTPEDIELIESVLFLSAETLSN